MTLKETVKQLVAKRDPIALRTFIERLDYNGWNGVQFDYNSMQLLFSRCAGLDAREFETLMQEIEE